MPELLDHRNLMALQDRTSPPGQNNKFYLTTVLKNFIFPLLFPFFWYLKRFVFDEVLFTFAFSVLKNFHL